MSQGANGGVGPINQSTPTPTTGGPVKSIARKASGRQARKRRRD